MFGELVVIHKTPDAYIVSVYLAAQEPLRRVYRKKNARQAALRQARKQAVLRKCGVAPKFSLTKNEQIGLRLAGVALVNEKGE